MDRCPHRNVPLSLGRVHEGSLVCAYHGWRFDARGRCLHVPGQCQGAPKGHVAAYAACEQDGYVWVWGRAAMEPTEAPPRWPRLGAAYTRLARCTEYAADLHASVENTIDVPHTAVLHRGLLRGHGRKSRVGCTVTRRAREVVARYQGETRPDTWLAKLLAPGASALVHEDRFMLPSRVQVEYRVGERAHLLSTACFTPLSERRTRVHVEVCYRLDRVPGAWLAPVLTRVADRVLREDAEILRAQTDNVARFGGPRFVSTELDAFSEHIRRLLEDAEADRLDADAHVEQRLEFSL